MTMKGSKFAIFGLTVGLALMGDANAKIGDTNPCVGLPNGFKLPNTEDCSSYFVCDYNQMTKTMCDEGTLFDPELMVCNWAQLVECGETPVMRPVETVPTTRRPVTVRTTTTRTTTQKANLVSNWQHEDIWQNRWPQSNTFWFPEVPPAPFYPNYPVYQPQFPQYGGSYNPHGFHNIPVTEVTTTTIRTTVMRTTTPRTTTPRTTTHRTTTTVRTTRIVTTRTPYMPPKSPSGPVIPLDEDLHLKCNNNGLYFLPHPKNCENYYICTNGVMVLHQCAAGIHWNEKESQCDFPHRANCFANQRPASAPYIEKPAPALVCNGNRFLPHPECDKYYICAGTTPTLMTCPENFLWNVSSSQCDPARLVNCARN